MLEMHSFSFKTGTTDNWRTANEKARIQHAARVDAESRLVSSRKEQQQHQGQVLWEMKHEIQLFDYTVQRHAAAIFLFGPDESVLRSSYQIHLHVLLIASGRDKKSHHIFLKVLAEKR
jgi:hypothetical protein